MDLLTYLHTHTPDGSTYLLTHTHTHTYLMDLLTYLLTHTHTHTPDGSTY